MFRFFCCCKKPNRTQATTAYVSLSERENAINRMHGAVRHVKDVLAAADILDPNEKETRLQLADLIDKCNQDFKTLQEQNVNFLRDLNAFFIATDQASAGNQALNVRLNALMLTSIPNLQTGLNDIEKELARFSEVLNAYSPRMKK